MGKRRTNDLIGLTLDVSDPESSVEFYTKALGMELLLTAVNLASSMISELV